jgi:acetyl-CoA carboxylase carboxyltransferase component
MFTSRTLTLYLEAIKLFKFLNLPLVTMIDTPGIDPRMDGNNQRTIDKVLSVTEEILSYPNKTIAFITGRGYGGANTLGIPKVYGSEAAYILDEDTEMNVMHESIIRKLLTGSPRLLDQWETSNQQQCEQFTDLIESGNIDRVINKTELKTLITYHLLDQQTQPKHDNLALASV